MTRKRKKKSKKWKEGREANKKEKDKLKIIENRVKYIDYKLKKTEKGKKHFLTRKWIEIYQIYQIFGDNPSFSIPQKFLQYCFNR